MSYLLAGHDLTKGAAHLRTIGDVRIFENRIRINQTIVRVRAAVTTHGMRLALSPIYGYEGVTEPRLPREDLPLTVHGQTIGYVDKASRQLLLNGQGPAPFEIYHDFRSRKTTVTHSDQFVANKLIPTAPQSTGGHWPYFGVTHHGPILHDVYQVGNYAGVWLNRDGSPIEQSQYPKAQMISHWHRDAKGYIRYTHPSTPYLDRGGRDPNGREFKCPDGQHLSVYCAPMEAALRDPTNPSLQLLTEDIARRMMWQFPEEDLGYYRFKPGAERQQGRVLLVAADAVRALRAQNNHELADELLVHLGKREVYAHKVWRDRISNDRLPFSGWGDLVSPAEVGIHYWGLRAIRDLFLDAEGLFIEELDWMIKACAQFCFDWTLRFEENGHVWYAPPYRVNQVTNEHDGPSGGRHFTWMAASSITEGDPEKIAALKEMKSQLEPRWTTF